MDTCVLFACTGDVDNYLHTGFIALLISMGKGEKFEYV